MNIDNFKKHFLQDISAGLVVFLIALPLCLGISMASGAPLFTGIIAGIVGGIVVGLVSGSNINVSGPAASVALVILTAIQTLGSFQAVLFSVILAGIIQIIAGFLRAGTIAYFFPNTMIKGILASIGLILILKQIPHAFGLNGAFDGFKGFNTVFDNGIENSFNEFKKLLNEFINILKQFNLGATIITVVSLAIMLVWEIKGIKKYLFFKYFPAALMAVIVSVVLNKYFSIIGSDLTLTSSHLVKLPIASNASEFISFFTLPDFSQYNNINTYTVALSIAFIASLESLLSTEAGDKLDPYKRKTSTNRELKAQGIGNIVAGFIGGLPITAVIVRTSANVDAGARTKTATVTHGILMFICVLFIPMVLNKIPLASLAAVLFVIGYKLTSVKVFKSAFKQGFKQFTPFIITILAVLFTDLITGIMIGGSIAVFFILRDNYKNAYVHDKVSKESNEKTVLKLAQETTFLNKADILLYLQHIPENHHLVIDGTDVKFIHPDIFEIINDFKETAKFKNITLELIDLDDDSKCKSFWVK